MTTISLCMIVKNEADVLDRCLSSVHAHVDEIVIVDTGSTDTTREIAHKYTDKIYDFEWCNDFSAARNESLKHAICDWILVLDADEYFEESEIRKLRNCLQNEQPVDYLVYYLSIVSFMGKKMDQSTNEASVGRVFANHKGIQFKRPIHEQPYNINGSELKSSQLPIRVLHTGYFAETIASKNKHDRNLEIFRQLEKKSGLASYDHLQLGNQYVLMNQHDQALHHLSEAMKGKRSLGTAYKQVLFSMLQTYINMGRLVDAHVFFEEHLQPYAEYPDIITIKGIILYNLGFTELAKQAFLEAVQAAEQRASDDQQVAIVSPDAALRLPLWQLAYMFEQERDYPKAIYYLTKLLIAKPKDAQALASLIRILGLKEEASQIAGLVSRLIKPEKDPLLTALLFKTSVTLGNKNLAAYYYNQLPSEQFGYHDLLRYHLLADQQPEFEQLLRSMSSDERHKSSFARTVVVGAISWRRAEWLNDSSLETIEETKHYVSWARTYFSNNLDPNANQLFAAELLRSLYVSDKLAAFDSIIDLVTSQEIINDLANFFYHRHQTETALQYYSHLLEQQALSGESCIQLAQYHLNAQLPQDALPFFEKAIELLPGRYNLYVQYCLHCTDPVMKEKMLQKLYWKNPAYEKLTLLR